jgi:hypothetical protein
MGSLLREKLKFINLHSVVKAYLQSFYTDADDIHNLIKDDSLVALFIMRNALVHKAGRVDSKFMSECMRSDRLKKWHGLTLRDVIEIDGADVKSLIEPAFKTGAALIVKVAEWIKQHPEPRKLHL